MRRLRGLLPLVLAALACGGGGGREAAHDDSPAPLRLPGTLSEPSGARVDVSSDSAVVIYCWMPLPGYAPAEEDLRFLAGLDGTAGARVFAVQLDPACRNAAQTQVNDLGIALPVFLADSVLARAVPCGVLPVAVLFVRGGGTAVETGSGCVQRLLAR